MTLEKFDEVLSALCGAKPFRAFTVELDNGQQLKIDYPLAFRDGVAVHLSQRGAPTIFRCDSVNQIIGATANTDL